MNEERAIACLPKNPNPAVWMESRFDEFGVKFVNVLSQRSVVISVSNEADGKVWTHLSVSYPGHLPSWAELRDTKRLFLGPESRALSVIPPDDEYVNIHPYCLHLFVCLDGDVTPDFRRGAGL